MTSNSLRKEVLLPMRLLGLRHIGPYHLIGETWEKFKAWAKANGVPISGAKHISIFHDLPGTTPPERLRSDACVAIPDSYRPPAGTKGLDAAAGEPTLFHHPGGPHAAWLYRGPYDGLGEAWGKFSGELVPAAGLRFGNGPCFEVYVNHAEKPEQGECLTDLFSPIME